MFLLCHMKDWRMALNSSSKAGLLGFYNSFVAVSEAIADTRASGSATKPLLYAFFKGGLNGVQEMARK